MNMAEATHVTSENATAKVIAPAFTNVDSKARGFGKFNNRPLPAHKKCARPVTIVTEAANAAKDIAESVSKLDKSLFTAGTKNRI